MEASFVRREMNRCAAAGIPFLAGADYELENGFFIENPLENPEILFCAGSATNADPDENGFRSGTNSALPSGLEILGTDEEAYAEKFRIARNGLLRGDSFLLNLTERTELRGPLPLERIFRESRARYKLYLPGRLVCFSPEIFVRISSEGKICSYPMKGTIDAGIPDAERLLLENYKERCEHYTIVDLIRNDLNRIASGVKIERFRYVERIRTLRGEILQTSSEISGMLPGGWERRLGDLFFSLLPAGSISGAPKESTCRLIRRAERIPRGYYTGVFGYFDGKELDSAVMIRYIEQEGDRFYFRSGGGITVNSDPGEEYREVLEKIYLPVPPRT